MTHLIFSLIHWLCELTNNSLKSAIATATGSAVGYTPSVVATIDGNQLSRVDVFFQHSVWTITIIVGVLAVINGIQKQIDRYKKRVQIRKMEEDEETID
jgi:hypothetical protein